MKTNLMQRETETFVAGQWVAPGVYQRIDSPHTVCLNKADYLPASLDGRVACYRRVQPTWGQQQRCMAE